MEKSIRNIAGSISYVFHMWKEKSTAYLNSDDMFSTYAQKIYMENIPCELALTDKPEIVFLLLRTATQL